AFAQNTTSTTPSSTPQGPPDFVKVRVIDSLHGGQYSYALPNNENLSASISSIVQSVSQSNTANPAALADPGQQQLLQETADKLAQPFSKTGTSNIYGDIWDTVSSAADDVGTVLDYVEDYGPYVIEVGSLFL